MAIQISEKHLSPKAIKALENAKSKSQLLRDALEYYVNRDEIEVASVASDPEMKMDIKEIKELLQNMSLQPAHTESIVVKDDISTRGNEDLKVGTTVVSEVPVIKHEDTVVEVADTSNQHMTEKTITATSNDDLSDEQKAQIAKNLDFALDF